LIHRLMMSAIPKQAGARFARRLFCSLTRSNHVPYVRVGDCARHAIPDGGGFK